jgi:RHS repeat-associated protein
MTLGNGVTVRWTYDQAYRLTRILAGSVLDRSYAYDAAGHLVGITDALAPGNSETFAYDAVDRLIHATGAYGDELYGYDAVGNRTSIARDGAADTYAYGATSQELQGISGATNEAYAYDANGNTTTLGALALTYDENNRLSSASSGGQLLATYESSVVGHRVRKTDASGNVTVYLYDGLSLMATADGDGNLLDQQVYLGGMRVAVLHGGHLDDADVTYVVHEQRGAPALVLDASGQVAWAGTYRPFGEVSVGASAVRNDLRLPGQVADAETGLYDNRLRAYDPRTGRFLQGDPLGLSGGLGIYVYAADSPAGFVDPLGLGKLGGSVYTPAGGFGFSISWDKTGFAYCSEVGFGAGASLDWSPFAKADPTHMYAEASYKLSLGPFSDEIKAGVESAPCGPQQYLSGTLSTGPYFNLEKKTSTPLFSLSGAEDEWGGNVSLKPTDWNPENFVKGFEEEAKVVAGACYHF